MTDLAKGLSIVEAVQVASTGSVDLRDQVSQIDDVTLEMGFRVLLTKQKEPSENGFYTVQSGLLVPCDPVKEPGKTRFAFVQRGTVNGNAGFCGLEGGQKWVPFNGNLIRRDQGLCPHCA